ncbi:MAG: hypothetical protein F4204_11780 [Rhodospirillaceae bacterium]|nr:hypothetical protein [Rhodospirillaceae bacterium]
MRGIILAAFVLLATGGAVGAERAKPVQRFVCLFDKHISPETDGISHKSPLTYEFTVDGTGQAFAVGKNIYPVRVVVGDRAVTFLEELASGAVQTTTINPNGKAVHSRHTILFGRFVPSQYYGTCK